MLLNPTQIADLCPNRVIMFQCYSSRMERTSLRTAALPQRSFFGPLVNPPIGQAPALDAAQFVVRSTKSCSGHKLFSTPAAMAGVIRSVLCIRTKL